MLLQCLRSSFGSIPPTVWEEMSFEVFQDVRHGSHLGNRNRTIVVILNLYNSPKPPIKFQLMTWLLDLLFGIRCQLKNFTMAAWQPSWILERNDFNISESLCHCDASIKFWLNPTYSLEGDVVWRISRWRPPWKAEQNNFSNSESLCHSDVSHKVSVQSDMVWEMSFEELQDGYRGSHLGYRNGMILAILNLCVTVMFPIKFWLNQTYGLGADVVWRISRCPPWRPSWLSERNNFSNFESLYRSDASHKVFAQSDLWFGRRCRLKNFKMAATAILAAILDIGTKRF